MTPNRLDILDICTDGDIVKFHTLVHPAYDHLIQFYQLCRDTLEMEDVQSIGYVFNNDCESSFNVKGNIPSDVIDRISESSYYNEDVNIKKVQGGFVLNISTIM